MHSNSACAWIQLGPCSSMVTFILEVFFIFEVPAAALASMMSRQGSLTSDEIWMSFKRACVSPESKQIELRSPTVDIIGDESGRRSVVDKQSFP